MDHRFKDGVQDGVSVGAVTTEILPARSGRKYAAIINDSDENIYLGIGIPAVMNKGIRLNANGGSFEIKGDNPTPAAINGICASGGKNATFFDAT